MSTRLRARFAAAWDETAEWLADLARYRRVAWLPIALSIAAAWLLTIAAGGTSSGLPHLFYLPVFFAAFVYGPLGGVGAAVVGGLVCGFGIPVDVARRCPQDTRTWALRLAAFVLAGAIVGVMASSLRYRAQRLERLNGQVVNSFVRAIDSIHRDMADHSTTVADTAVSIAEALGLSRKEVERVRGAALLHDIGKLAIPREIISKPGPLTPEEWALVREHPVESERIIKDIEHFHPYLAGIRHHHERCDGSGYPDRLQGGEIPLEARIIAVADALDAMTAQRAYRAPLSNADALEQLKQSVGTQFDAAVVDALVTLHQPSAEEVPRPPRIVTSPVPRS